MGISWYSVKKPQWPQEIAAPFGLAMTGGGRSSVLLLQQCIICFNTQVSLQLLPQFALQGDNSPLEGNIIN